MVEFFFGAGAHHLADEVIAKAREHERAVRAVAAVRQRSLVVGPEEFLPAVFHDGGVSQEFIFGRGMFDLRLHGIAHELFRSLIPGLSGIESDGVSKGALLGLLDHEKSKPAALLMDGARQSVDALALC